MTIGQSLKEWIQEYDGFDIEPVTTDIVESLKGSYALFKSPNNVVNEEYQDGTKLRTDFFQFYSRRSTLLDEERIDNQEELEAFADWIEHRDFEEDYPNLGENVKCVQIGVNSSCSILSVEEDSIIYQITIYVKYIK